MYLDEMLGGGFVLVIAGVLCAYAIRTLTIGRAVDARVARESGTILLGRFPIEAIHWAARGAGFFLVRRKVSPDALTLSALAITSVTIPLAATGHHLVAGCVFLLELPSMRSTESSRGRGASLAKRGRCSMRSSIDIPTPRRSSGLPSTFVSLPGPYWWSY